MAAPDEERYRRVRHTSTAQNIAVAGHYSYNLSQGHPMAGCQSHGAGVSGSDASKSDGTKGRKERRRKRTDGHSEKQG